ncbi:MAG: lysoplasmalogenase [Acidimicrobiia bacterium]|nr:lysoplasmalogenase [Acidimicrobiia bacterium]
MTSDAWVLLAAAATLALVDWWAVWNRRPSVRHIAKPGTLVALIGVAIALDPFDPAIRTWMVAGLVLSLAGDVFLMLAERWFIAGLVSFLLGHVAYVVALQQAPRSLAWSAVSGAVVIACGVTIGRRIVARVGAGSNANLAGPVVAYLVVISAMVVSAFGTAAALAIVGALLFYASDATLAWNRFVEPRKLGPLAVMVTYHLGQAGLVGWLVTG